MKIIVYGVGKRGKEFIEYVCEVCEDIDIVAWTDSSVKSVSLENGTYVPYINNYDIKTQKFDYIVVTPKKYYGEIKDRIMEQGVEDKKIVLEEAFWKIYGKKYGKRYCNLCDNLIFDWKNIGEKNEIFLHLNIVGASKRKGGCPICASSDRIRYVYYVLKNYTGIFENLNGSILHFAPEPVLSQKLYRSGYVSADIESGRADVIADITDLQFHKGQFDYIICNHVMEHIHQEQKAFSEIWRCLRKNGILVLTVPICWEQKTFEDNSINTVDKKIKYYGQKDHVRLYGNDIVNRIEGFGFEVELYRSDEVLEENEIQKFGFINKDTVLLCKKVEP